MKASDREELLDLQDWRCAICHEGFSSERKSVIDHCHISGYVRGLLCHECNIGLGFLRDTAAYLARGAAYLRHPPAEKMKIRYKAPAGPKKIPAAELEAMYKRRLFNLVAGENIPQESTTVGNTQAVKELGIL